jgi:hypothetical protein
LTILLNRNALASPSTGIQPCGQIPIRHSIWFLRNSIDTFIILSRGTTSRRAPFSTKFKIHSLLFRISLSGFIWCLKNFFSLSLYSVVNDLSSIRF